MDRECEVSSPCASGTMLSVTQAATAYLPGHDRVSEYKEEEGMHPSVLVVVLLLCLALLSLFGQEAPSS